MFNRISYSNIVIRENLESYLFKLIMEVLKSGKIKRKLSGKEFLGYN